MTTLLALRSTFATRPTVHQAAVPSPRGGRVGTMIGAVLVLAGAAAPVQAQSYALLMQGVLDGRSSLGTGGVNTPFAAGSAFTLEAFFSTTSPNLVAPIGIPGFVAYTPSELRLTIGGRTYSMQGFDAAHPTGVSVAIFDRTTPFGVPNRYGVGIIQNPLADGAGFIADYMDATVPFMIGSTGLVPTTFTGYSGVGVSSGVCTVGTPASCQAHAVTPIPMTWNGQSFQLTFGNYEDDAPPTPVFSATLVATPEPGTLPLLAIGVVGGALLAGRRRRVRR